MNRKTPLLIAVLASMAVSAHAQNLVTNPGFETGDFTGWTYIDCQVIGPPHSGSYAAQFGQVVHCGGNTCGGSLDQTITTVAGQLYHVDFWLNNYNGNAFFSGFSASFAGVTILSLHNSPTFPYTHFSGNVTATSTSSLLHFN